MRFWLAGTFATNAMKLRSENSVRRRSKVHFVLEPDNPFDSKAIACFLGPEKVGYVPRVKQQEFEENKNKQFFVTLVEPDGRSIKIQVGTRVGNRAARRKKSGVYEIWFENLKSSGRYSYVGSSVDIEGRVAKHLSELRNGKHENKEFLDAFKDFGEEKMKWRTIKIVNNPNALKAVEAKILEKRQRRIHRQKRFRQVMSLISSPERITGGYNMTANPWYRPKK